MKTFQRNFRILASSASVALLLSPLVQTAGAQASGQAAGAARARAEVMANQRIGPEGLFQNLLSNFGTTNRALIGVTTTSGSRADTLGVLVEDVTAGGPADKAGLKVGSRITAVNGVSLRVSPADTDDPELKDLGQRRLIREIGKAKVGDEVELRVLTGSTTQTLKLKTVSPSDLLPQRTVSVMPGGRVSGLEKRASIGASIGTTGSVRDTLGIFISSVTTGGPAEKAGVVEGDRIAAINGVDVRVSHEDAEDFRVASARVNRFMRELAKLAPGDKATLRVYSDGKYREVVVTTGSSTDTMLRGFQFNNGEGMQSFSIPRLKMQLDDMPMIIRKGTSGDSDRIVYRKVVPSGSVIRKTTVTPKATLRKSSQQ
ncbi:MAG: PDZ domain-containing protein [Gemmatimonas sp.]